MFAVHVHCRANGVVDDFEALRQTQLWKADHGRYLALEYVKAFPIDAASPFDLAERASVRQFLALMNKGFDVTRLNSTGVSANASTEAYPVTGLEEADL